MEDLITLSEFKKFAGMGSDNTNDDSQLKSLISAASNAVKTYCGRQFVDYVDTDKVELFDIVDNESQLFLEEFPLISITSVEERDSISSAYATLTTGAYEYYYNTTTDAVVRTSTGGEALWSKGLGAVRITYKAGYQEDSIPLPEELKLATASIVTYYFKNEHKISKTLMGGSMQNSASSTQSANVGFPDHIKRILDLYKAF